MAFAHSTTYGSCESRSPARMLCRSLFAAAPWHSRRSPEAPLPVFRNHRTAAAKEEQGASGSAPSAKLPQLPMCGSKRGAGSIPEFPQLPNLPYVVEWTQALESATNNPRTRRKKAFQAEPEMPPPSLFLLTPSKGAFSFSSEKEKGGFEAAAFAAPPCQRDKWEPYPRKSFKARR